VETALHTTKLVHDKSIKARLFYNISRVLTRIGELEDSTAYCLEAIKWCFEEELLWGLGELHYQIGYNYELVGDYEKALPYFKHALHMFEIREDKVYIAFLITKINEISERLQMG
jgi:tetratricopeptide (TPR) repeat protein